MPGRPPILVAGCGNVGAGDDAFGPRVIRHVRRIAPAEVEVVDLGLNPAALLDHLEKRRGLILVDAVVAAGHAAGELLDMDCAEVGHLPIELEPPGGTHDFGLGWQLKLAWSLALIPARARLVALTIEQWRLGQEVSPMAAAAVPGAAKLIKRWWQQWLAGAAGKSAMAGSRQGGSNAAV